MNDVAEQLRRLADEIEELRSTPGVEPALLSVSDASRFLAISERSMWRLLESGEIPPVMIGGRTLVERDVLLSYVRARRVQ